ncbi:MAG: hypothetical protein IJ190_12925 [Prevotella sp.]|nr:hypothetical protein [Prevotella sp.]
MKKTIVLLVCVMVSMLSMAQDKRKFSPEKFQADLEAFIKQEAKFSDEEAAKYFPLLREMQQKQRSLYARMHHSGKEKPADEKGCEATIRDCDRINIELKQLEQTYHKKMIQVLPASKVYDAIKAENRFHRRMMKGWQHSKDKPKDRR